MKEDLIDLGGEDEQMESGTPRRSIASAAGPLTRARLSKRESVPSMVFNGLKRRLSTKVLLALLFCYKV